MRMMLVRSSTMSPAIVALAMLASLFTTTSAFLPVFGGVHQPANAVQTTRLFSSVDADVSVLSLSLAKPLGMMLEGTSRGVAYYSVNVKALHCIRSMIFVAAFTFIKTVRLNVRLSLSLSTFVLFLPAVFQKTRRVKPLACL
jgi:hypothetical protein